nr:hypothetical protein [Tanacetum cinerariifolium]
HVEVGQQGVAERQHGGAELVAALVGGVVQVAEAGQRVGQARDGRLGHAGAFRHLAVAEGRFAGPEAAQDLEAARQRRHELAVLGDVLVVE